MIARIWHGYTSHHDAEDYQALLESEIFTEIKNKNIDGFIGIELLRRTMDEEVEFITIMHFSHMQALAVFAGEDCTAAVVPDTARKLLKRFDVSSQHYQVIKTLPETETPPIKQQETPGND